MSYQALYRKYRPKSFDDVTGQSITIKILQNSIINNKVAHAYLFYGPRGTGKTSVAKIFSRAVNCESTKNGIQCEKCDYCMASSQKECMDIIEIDAASNNGVDEIRELKSKVSFVPTELKYKVYIIDEVHMLSSGAFNALLKTLEEPPEYIIFILATTELNKVPSTIVSRCQTMEFKKLTENQIVDRLKYISDKEKIDITDEALLEIAKNSNGGLRDAIGLLEKSSTYKESKIEIDDVRLISSNISKKEIESFKDLFLNKDISEIINKINYYYDNGIDLSKIVYNLIELLTDDAIKNNNSNTSSIIFKLDELLSNMNKSDNPKLLMEVAILNILYDNKNAEDKILNIQKINIKPNDIKETISEKKENRIINNNNDDIEIKNIRIGNTLSRAKREYLDPFKKNWKEINNLAFDNEYGNIARLLVSDINPAAASDEYLVLKSKLNGISESINNDLLTVEKILKKVFNMNYKIICVSEKEWNDTIELYKKDKDSFVYKKEEDKKNKEEKSLKNKAKELFED